MVELAGMNLDDTPLGFGKYKGKTPNEIAEDNPGYIVWMHETMDNSPCSDQLYNDCWIESEFNKSFEERWD